MLKKIKTKLTEEDRRVLKAHEGIVEGIAAFMGKYCEVTLHSFEDPEHAVIKIVNNHHTHREIGSPLSEQGAQIALDYLDSGQQDRSCYTTISAKGEPMRSLFTVIVNKDKPIGLLGINLNMTIPLTEFISTFSLFHGNEAPAAPAKEQLSATSVEELVHNAVSDMVVDISTNINIPNHEKNKYIVYGLQEKGLFDIKGSVQLVAKELKLSKYTIYSYIRELKDNN